MAPGHAGVWGCLGVGLYDGVGVGWPAGVCMGCDGVIIGVIIGVAPSP